MISFYFTSLKKFCLITNNITTNVYIQNKKIFKFLTINLSGKANTFTNKLRSLV